MTRQDQLKKILNTAEFGSKEWNKASDELHDLRVAELEKNHPKLPGNWCTSDGEWGMK